MADEELLEQDVETPEQEPEQEQEQDQDEKQAESGTALDVEDEDGKVPADWPEDWRARAARGDEKLVKQLERYKSPVDVANALFAAQQKIRTGELKTSLPEDASEEDIAAWRKDNGIPEKPDGYLDMMSSGVVIGEDDKPLVESFLKSAHAKNASPDVVASAVEWYYEQQEETAAARAEADTLAAQTAVDALRAEWGNEYRQNINAVKSFLGQAGTTKSGDDVGDMLMGARLPDGTPLASHPDVLRWLANTASTVNPGGFLAPGDTQTQLQAMGERKAEIEKLMRTNRKEYNRNEAIQAEYRKILEAEEKLGDRTTRAA